MKAILEGTAAEFRQFFRTGAPEDFDSEQTCMFCGCTDEDACPGGCSWVAPGVCSRCAEIVHEGLKQGVSRVQKAAKNADKRIKTTIKAPEEATPDKLNPDDLLIPAFEHDRKLKSSYKTLFFTEMEDGRAVLSYCATKLYVNREKVLELPYPVPHGYFGRQKSGTPSNRVTAIRFYRAYLAEQPVGEKKLKSEKPLEIEPTLLDLHRVTAQKHELEEKGPDVKPTLLSGTNGKVVLAPFAEAERFDYSSLSKNTLGPVVAYENGDGRIALKYYGHGDIVFITREQVEVLKKMDKDAFAEYIYDLNASKQFVLRKYIEALKDDAIGALGMVKTDTRVPKD